MNTKHSRHSTEAISRKYPPRLT